MATILFVREGSPPGNIASTKNVSVAEIIENFGDNPSKYVKKPYSDNPTINSESGPANPVASPQHIIVKISQEDVDTKTFSEAGCYLVKDVAP